MIQLTIGSIICIILAVTFASYQNLAVDLAQAWSLCK